jgi:hypothetical protein
VHLGRAALNLLAVAAVAATFDHVRGKQIRLPGVNRGYSPRQPIAFSHRLHCGELEMSCLYCHSGADKSRNAGLPAGETCMNCHRWVTAAWSEVQAQRAKPDATGLPRPVSRELQKLYDAVGYDPEEPEGRRSRGAASLAWVRVHDLPDYVRFDHMSHVNAGVGCTECHGPVEEMERVSQWSDLTMGWCVNCHRKTGIGSVLGFRMRTASTDCSACHY